jgi:hypothetical protein
MDDDSCPKVSRNYTHTYGANKKISRGPNRQDKQNENEGGGREKKQKSEKKVPSLDV